MREKGGRATERRAAERGTVSRINANVHHRAFAPYRTPI